MEPKQDFGDRMDLIQTEPCRQRPHMMRLKSIPKALQKMTLDAKHVGAFSLGTRFLRSARSAMSPCVLVEHPHRPQGSRDVNSLPPAVHKIRSVSLSLFHFSGVITVLEKSKTAFFFMSRIAVDQWICYVVLTLAGSGIDLRLPGSSPAVLQLRKEVESSTGSGRKR